MFRLWTAIKKDFRILVRDRVGLVLLFVMPILLALVITTVQNSTFELVNDNKIRMLVYNKDSGQAGRELVLALRKMGLYELTVQSGTKTEEEIRQMLHAQNELTALLVPAGFSSQVEEKSRSIASRSLKDIAVQEDPAARDFVRIDSLTLFYHPVMQESFRRSVEGSISSALQVLQSKSIVRNLYFTLHEKDIPDTLQQEIINSQIPIRSIPVSRSGARRIPNATEHNIPAWTIFAIFFIVVSLSGNVVREKTSGSFIRLRTMPTHFYLAILSKQIVYMGLTLVQALVIFMIGLWLFPRLGLPALHLPQDKIALLLVTLVCGAAAASYAICVGVFAETQEQANGFGAVSVVLLAAIGGLLVPSFVMPASFQGIMKLSPLHWCLESYYGLFLEGGKLSDIWANILSLLVIILLLQILSVWRLKRKQFI